MKRLAVMSLAIFLIFIPIMAVYCDSDEGNHVYPTTGKGNLSEDIGIKPLPEGFIWYQNDVFGFKMAYPEDWYIWTDRQDDDEYNVDIREIKLSCSLTDASITNSGCIDIHVIAPFDLNSAYDWAESKEEMLINGRQGYTFIGKSSVGDYDDDGNLETHTNKIINTVLDVNGKYFIIAGVCLQEVWDEKVPVFDNAIRSFIIE